MLDNGHYNAIRASVFVGGWYGNTDPASIMTIPQVIAILDNTISLAQQTGQYVVIDNHTADANNCQNWDDVTALWTAVAPRYANDTNVVYEIQNEPDFC